MPARPESNDNAAPERCLINGCGRTAGLAWARGLCPQCYSTAKRLVESGSHTWADLVRLGLARADDDPFTRALRSCGAQGATRGTDAGQTAG